MGFSRTLGQQALISTNNNITAAANMLLSGNVPPVVLSDLVRSLADSLAPVLAAPVAAFEAMEADESEEALLAQAIALSMQTEGVSAPIEQDDVLDLLTSNLFDRCLQV